MHPIIKKTFGGLTRSYYFRHLFFGILIAIFYSMLFASRETTHISVYGYFAVCTLLYPYSRYVYERVVSFIVGNNVFILNVFVMLFFKAFTMMMCWGLSVLIAPIGLVYLYFHHTKNEKLVSND